MRARTVEIVSADDEFLGTVREVVEANLENEDFNVGALATGVNLSRGHLHRRLRDLIEQSPSQIIQTIRLERAAQMLQGKTGNVSEVAYGTGFKSVSHFSRCFKRKYGCPPSDMLSGECIPAEPVGNPSA